MKLAGMSEQDAPPLISKIFYVVVIGALSWLIFHARLPAFVKATMLTMLLMIAMVFIGISLYGQPIALSITVDAVLLGATAVFIRYKKLHWIYYAAIGYVALLGSFIVLFDVQI